MSIGSGVPAAYDYINIYNAVQTPSTVHVTNTSLAWFFRRYLLQDAMSVFEFKLPKDWAEDYFLYVLYCWGFLSIVRTDKYGVIPQACGLRGYDVFYRPTNAVISNPLLRGILEPRIGVDCTLVKLQPDYGGIYDLVCYYGDMMALAAEACGVNLLNSKLAYVFMAENKASAESLKKIYDRIASGEPAVVFDKSLKADADGKLPWDTFSQNVGQNFIADRLLDALNTITNMYRTHIGLPNANTDKKERLITDEVHSNDTATISKCEMWLQQLRKSFAEANDMFGLELSVDWRNKPLPTDPAPEPKREEGDEA